ncbi:type I-B CRISPR-associated protein Cas5b [Methanocaldococcus infernus]
MIRVKLKSWTATFRYPTFQSGYQPTLPLPPISTILGLLSAAKGEIVNLEDVEFFGYIFKSEGKGVDLEKTYYLSNENEVKTDVIRREFLFNNTLYLYLPDGWKTYFKSPRYQLLLGRSCDIATVEEIKKINLEMKREVPIGGTILPLEANVSGMILALPVEFDYSKIPRCVKLVKPFVLLPYPKDRRKLKTYSGELPYDDELNLGVWIYDKSLFS